MSCIIGFLASGPAKRSDIMANIGYANLTKNVKNILVPLIEEGYISVTNPEKPTHSNQKYQLTEKGRRLLLAAK